MARKPALRAVSADEAPARKHTVTSAASVGDRLELLVAMRSRVATAVEDPNTPARDLAALTRRLMEIAKEIEALEAEASEEVGFGGIPDADFDAEAL